SYNWDEARANSPDLWIFHVLRREAEAMIVSDDVLAKIGKGDAMPTDAAERVALAILCQQPYRQLNMAAARRYQAPVAVDPNLADALTLHRYNAARAAALVGTGQGKDAENLDEKERSRWRKQALDWLRADLGTYEKLLASGTFFVRQRLVDWQRDSGL